MDGCEEHLRKRSHLARQYGLTYSQFMGRLAKQNIGLNRKVLADLAMNNPQAFEAIVNSVK